MKKLGKCRNKQCKYIAQVLKDQAQYIGDMTREITRLNSEIKKLKEVNFESLERMKARTELMKAISLLSKTASSALWSDRKMPWYPDKGPL